MFIRSQRFPISDGTIVATLRAELASTWGDDLFVGTKVPEAKTLRMVTVRDDSGPVIGRVQARRQGINVWAESSVDALNLALDSLHVCEALLPTGDVIAATSGFVGPYDVEDEVPFVVASKNLFHYYFAFVADVKAAAA